MVDLHKIFSGSRTCQTEASYEIFADNATKRLFAVSHSDENAEESIVAFDVADGDPPSLRFRFALTSAAFRYYGAGALWFLNDVAAVDGEAELYATQFGPRAGKE